MEIFVQFSVHGGDSEVKNFRKLEILRRKLEELGIEMGTFTPGQHNHLQGPMVSFITCYSVACQLYRSLASAGY